MRLNNNVYSEEKKDLIKVQLTVPHGTGKQHKLKSAKNRDLVKQLNQNVRVKARVIAVRSRERAAVYVSKTA